MRLTSQAAEKLVRPVIVAFDGAVDDTLELARAHANRNRRSGKFSRSLTRTPLVVRGTRIESRIGSPLASARVKERGGYITAKRGPYLVFNAGDGVRKVAAVRVPPEPVVAPAGRRFPVLMSARLRRVVR